MEERMPAILDTDSMISILPAGVLARTRDAGFDVNSLEVLPESSMVLLTLALDEIKHSEEVKDKRLMVAKRIYVPPHESALVEARCEGESEVEERVVWPKRDGLAAGVFKIRNQELEIPIMNNSEEPMIPRRRRNRPLGYREKERGLGRPESTHDGQRDPRDQG
ncbi:hypothetical protein ANCCAN_14522 [Ancylostoma caninum]|uniref:Uncharacterized protein n=1 Tax=Ancylostoma caninum TaxID=29170 RepID=A0A368G963_ANCCA|nr:hypothetical protein ANCCAN_14522 [Ancylostoma caninum]